MPFNRRFRRRPSHRRSLRYKKFKQQATLRLEEKLSTVPKPQGLSVFSDSISSMTSFALTSADSSQQSFTSYETAADIVQSLEIDLPSSPNTPQFPLCPLCSRPSNPTLYCTPRKTLPKFV